LLIVKLCLVENIEH